MVWRRSCVLRSKSLVPRIRAARLCTHRREGCPLRHCEFSSSLCRNICRSRLLQNYDFPNNCEDYIHRIGRTGRAGMTGTSYTYFTTDNAKQARELIGILREAKAHVPPQLEEMSMFGGGGGGRSTSCHSVRLCGVGLTSISSLGRYGGGGGGRGRGGGGGGGRFGGGHDNGYGGRNNDRW
ncbi:hypothetical protein BD311DRAFT_518078 [Dichomitus squalens]|uniref:Helicase C-terminal domain-containing protein n=1 Tax=Dichomitus squalens TaxID=114155 RepID=A0A4V2JZI3_9APHY|nr:hypothetical protein BD311DRAFT_518078 [Dichomitus squalens]